MKNKRHILLLLIVSIFILAACGSKEPNSGGGTTEETTAEEKPVYCADADGDGYGNCKTTTTAPLDPKKWVLKSESKGEDCDDTNPAINPDAIDTCGDGKDNDCKDGDAVCAIVCTDTDGDGYTVEGAICNTAIDCDDSNAAINPGATEVCEDLIDNDCDGVDDICLIICTDDDKDGYFVEGLICGTEIDCDDTNPAVNPGAAEVCPNNIDDNCDGNINEGFLNTLCHVEIIVVGSEGTYTQEQHPDTNYGSDDIYNTGNVGGYIYDTGEQKAFVGFVLPSTPGYKVLSAEFSITSIWNAVTNNQVVTGDTVVCQVAENWGPMTLTYNDMPSDGARCVSKAMDNNSWVLTTSTWDVTPIAAAWDNGEPAFGLSIKTQNLNIPLSATFVGIGYYSDPMLNPVLVLTLEPISSSCTDADGDGYSPDGGCGPIDCDDNDSTIHPTAPEWCDYWDSIDSDCNGITDNNGQCYG